MKQKVTCNFCGLTIDEVEHMIAGPDVYICNECIELCMELWQDVQKEKKEMEAYTANQRITDNITE